jgi:hypothetical protein
MGRGFQGVKSAAEDIEKRRSSSGQKSSFAMRFRLKESGEEAVVRFLEQDEDVNWAWVAALPPKDNQRFGEMTPIRDQERDGSVPCPFQERGITNSFRGWINLIWRDAPVYKRDGDGRLVRESGELVIVDHADQVCVWEQGINVFNELYALDKSYKGLMSRDFRITRLGEGLSTKYRIEPAEVDGGPQPMSKEDKKLAEGKYDLTQFTTPKSYEELERLLDQRSSRSAMTSDDVNPFLRR